MQASGQDLLLAPPILQCGTLRISTWSWLPRLAGDLHVKRLLTDKQEPRPCKRPIPQAQKHLLASWKFTLVNSL